MLISGAHTDFPVRSTIPHWQLRDVLSCPTTDTELYTMRGTDVIRFDTQTRFSELAASFDYSPSAMHCSDGYLVVGGQSSELFVKNLHLNLVLFSSTVGESINNSCRIWRGSNGQTRLIVSNNDNSIRIFSLPDMEQIHEFVCPVSVNYSSMSPDGNFLVAVGDGNDVYLYNVSDRDNHSTVSIFPAAKDAGFGCAWDVYSRNFAAGFQDGSMSIWDIRMIQSQHVFTPITTLNSLQRGRVLRGAVRNVKYSTANGADVLVFTEHCSFFHVVDARSYTTDQFIRAGNNTVPATSSVDIAGIAFSPSSKYLYVALEDKICRYDFELWRRRTFGCGEPC